jgi:hypothetical protein
LAHLLAHAREASIPQLVRAHALRLARWRAGALARCASKSASAGWLNEWGTSTIAVDPESGKVRDLEGGSQTVALSGDGRFALAYSYNNAGVTDEGDASVLIVPYGGGEPKVIARGAVAPSWNR